MVRAAFNLRRQLIIKSMQELEKSPKHEAQELWRNFSPCAILYGTTLLRIGSIAEALPVFADAMQASLVRNLPNMC